LSSSLSQDLHSGSLTVWSLQVRIVESRTPYSACLQAQVLSQYLADLAYEFLGHCEELTGWMFPIRLSLDLMDRLRRRMIRNQVDAWWHHSQTASASPDSATTRHSRSILKRSRECKTARKTEPRHHTSPLPFNFYLTRIREFADWG
jgi:hypothetical protein